jgi:hypothetical protein
MGGNVTMLDNTKRLYSLQDLAGRLGGSSIWTIRAHIKNGSIACVRLGARVFVSEDELDRILRSGLPSLKHKNAATEQATSLK